MFAGQVIKLIRTADGLQQGQFAQSLDVSRTYLSQVENGRKEPSISFLKRCSKELRVPLPLLLFSEQNPNDDDNVLAELRKILAGILMARASQLSGGKQLEFRRW
ncbi:MAG: helix-turn-helix transcriptional regulator [Sedimentisphaerales bacterium]|jgi:transcriptional regulator with XRE-family HTH domain